MANNKGLRTLGFVGCLGAAVAVFVVCSIVQGIGHSNMFSTSFPKPNNAFLEFAMQVTWWPGWIATIGLTIAAIGCLMAKSES